MEWGSLVAPSVKNLPANVGDLSSVSGLGRSPGEGHGNPLSIFAWRIPWTEEPGGLQFMGPQRVRHDWATNTHTQHIEYQYGYWFIASLLPCKIHENNNLLFCSLLYSGLNRKCPRGGVQQIFDEWSHDPSVMQEQKLAKVLASRSDKNVVCGTSLVVTRLRLHPPVQGVRVRFLIWKLRFHIPCGQKNKTRKQKQHCNKFNNDFKNGPHPKKKKENP